ncbi:hypothetical protein BU26DRAFT_410664, partial [Trematosphaeria pertusa]
YELSPTTFKKSSRPKEKYDAVKGGDVFYRTRHWKTERILNEARALLLLAKTKIPVPKLIQCGDNDDGTTFLEMSREDGIELSEVGKACHMPGTVEHSHVGECENCKAIAQASAKDFIRSILLPELANLTSDTTGLDGFVIPPAWMLETDTRSKWEPMTFSEPVLIFIHGDLGPSNLLMDPKTLTVKCVIDWEHSGYFLPEFQKW